MGQIKSTLGIVTQIIIEWRVSRDDCAMIMIMIMIMIMTSLDSDTDLVLAPSLAADCLSLG